MTDSNIYLAISEVYDSKHVLAAYTNLSDATEAAHRFGKKTSVQPVRLFSEGEDSIVTKYTKQVSIADDGQVEEFFDGRPVIDEEKTRMQWRRSALTVQGTNKEEVDKRYERERANWLNAAVRTGRLDSFEQPNYGLSI